ncbi:MAG: hypothetical protein ACLGIG_10580 [Actinomycetes bacterium]
MNSPVLLLVLLALPLVTGAAIVAVSALRRRRGEAGVEPLHRLQTATAAAQDAAAYRASRGPRITSGRERRGAAAGSPDER